jgi:hypothetical protein
MDIMKLALELTSKETEKEIVEVLTKEGFWDDLDCWRPYGDNENNFSIIGNQQSNPDAALVEKLINSVDAALMKECAIRGIDVTSKDAPQSINEALEQFYKIRHGKIMMMDSDSRSEMSKNIILASTGKTHGEENLTIVDKGEGQTPTSMPDTILSISKSNKLKVPFVQGKFNMGGTGALPFCGKHHMELIISKRCPEIADRNDPKSDEWSVTVVRKEAAREGRKSSMYTYLTDKHGNILSFKSPSLSIIPTPKEAENEKMEYGTYIKLFNYDMNGYKTNINLDFYYRLSLLIPDLAHPIRIRECRSGYKGHSLETTLSGMITRLYDDRSGNIEDDFPSSDTFVVDGQELSCSIYLFKKDKQRNYRRKNEGVLFVVNGQTQGILQDNFFNRVNLSYLKRSLLVMVDCSKMDISHQEGLFMTSRDRLRNSEFSKDLEKQLETILKNHRGLKDAEYERRTEALKDKINDDKPLKDVLQNILQKSSVLSKLFITGAAISSPMAGEGKRGAAEKFKGKKHPTFFTLTGKMKDGKLTKRAPINHSFRIQFETDVQNDYFFRPEDAGYLVLKMDGEVRTDLKQSLNLFNGIATLTVSMPTDAKVGDTHIFETSIEDECITDSFTNIFEMVVENACDNSSGGGNGKRKEHPDKNKKGKNAGFAMPEIIQVYQDEWDEYGMDQYSALQYRSTDTGGDYYLNMDNAYLLNELKSIKDRNKSELTKARYIYSMTLVAMSVVGYFKNNKKDNEDVDIEGQVAVITTMISPVIIPMLESMANLDINDYAA